MEAICLRWGLSVIADVVIYGVYSAVEIFFVWHHVIGKIDFLSKGIEGVRNKYVCFIELFCV